MKKTIAILAALCALGAQAQQTIEVDLPRALQIALGENPTIRVADLEIERQDYVKRETWGNLLPHLSATAAYQNSIVKSEITKGLSFEPTHNVAMGATLSLPLVVPGVYQTLKLNDEQMRAALEAARGSRITMANEVRKAFFNVLRIEREIAVLEASQSTVRETVDQIGVSFENGLASEYDLLTAQVQLSNLDPTIVQARSGSEIAGRYLKVLMGMPLDQPVRFVGDLNRLEREYAPQGLPEQTDLAGNSDLRAMDIQRDILSRQLKVLRTQRMPTLAANLTANLSGHDPINFDMAAMSGGATGWQADGTYIGQPGGIWSPEGGRLPAGWTLAAPTREVAARNNSFMWQHPVALSFALSVPIFSGLTNSSREKQLKNNIRQLTLQREYAQSQTEVAAQTAISNVHTALQRMASTQKTVEQARKAYEISGVRYKAGAGTILELNSAELQLTQSQLNHTQAVYDLLCARADYEKIAGNQ